MPSVWQRLDEIVGRAVTRIYGETVLVSPQVDSQYTAGAPDASRPERTIRGVFGLEHDTEDLRGQRLKGEFAGITRVTTAAAHLLVAAAEYALLAYDLRRGDRITLTDQTAAPAYRITAVHPLDCGDRFILLSREQSS